METAETVGSAGALGCFLYGCDVRIQGITVRKFVIYRFMKKLICKINYHNGGNLLCLSDFFISSFSIANLIKNVDI